MKTLTCLRRRLKAPIVTPMDAQQDWQYLIPALRHQQRSKDILAILSILTVFPFITSIGQTLFWLCRFPGDYFHPVLCFLVTTPMTCVMYLYMNRTEQQYTHTLQRLVDYKDGRLVGPLVEQLSRFQASHFVIIAHMLIELLPRLKLDEYELLDKRQRARLFELLEYPTLSEDKFACDEALALAVLKALEQVGSKEAIHPVESAARMHENGKVREAARHCLPFLQERAGQHLSRQILLRPADKHDTRTAELLIPYLAAPQTPFNQLVRDDMALHD